MCYSRISREKSFVICIKPQLKVVKKLCLHATNLVFHDISYSNAMIISVFQRIETTFDKI